jgi:LAO/AO transport system kinase
MKNDRELTTGDILSASRLMRDLEDRVPGALERLKDLYLKTGRAYVIGVTGAPGSGKSTLVDKLIEAFRNEGKSVGVIAVDPSSAFSGGAILGDRIRMQRHATDEEVFIRSLATRGCLGGLCRATQDIINVMDAMGKDIIIVETVGVGQNEIDIVHMAHTSIVVLVPGMGDEMQAIKAGIVEIGDIFVINKCEREGVEKVEGDLQSALGMALQRKDGWEPPVFRTEATSGKGIAILVTGIYRHKAMLEQGQGLAVKLREQMKITFLKILESMVMEHFMEKIEDQGLWDSIITELVERRTDPYTMAERIMAQELVTRASSAPKEEEPAPI